MYPPARSIAPPHIEHFAPASSTPHPLPNPVTRPHPNTVALREARAWDLRCRGWSQSRIARALDVTQSGVSKMLDRIEVRELKRMSESVEREKVTQTGQLGHIIEQAMDAWHRSRKPRKRAASKTTGGGEGPGGDSVVSTEVIERDGDPAHLYVAMNAMDRVRSLWGLDVAPAMQDPAASVADLARDVFARAAAYEQRLAAPAAAPAEPDQAGHPGGTPGPDPGRAEGVPG